MPNSQFIFRVLIADDEKIIADTLALILSLNGFEATAVYSGEQAVDVARTLRPHALVSDICMEKMSGVDAALHIQEFAPGCEVVLMSGLAGSDMLAEISRHNPGFVLCPKPFDPRILLEILAAICKSKMPRLREAPREPESRHPVFRDFGRSHFLQSVSCLSLVGSCSASKCGAY